MKRSLWIPLFLVLVPAAVVALTALFPTRSYLYLSFGVLAFSVIPVILRFQKKEIGAFSLVLIAALTALSIVSRIAFAPFPGFKPVTALTIIAALSLGPEAGYLCGALTALVSNVYFGQGPWTPFQMAIWGGIGFLAGCFAAKLKKSRWLLYFYGAFSGIALSLLMDVWTAIWADGTFNIHRYLALLIGALPFTLLYAVSNVLFLLLLQKPVTSAIERVRTKYGQ